jgi:hypothetical protein
MLLYGAETIEKTLCRWGGNPRRAIGDSPKGKELYEHALHGVAAMKKLFGGGGSEQCPEPAANGSGFDECMVRGDYLSKGGGSDSPYETGTYPAAAIGRRSRQKLCNQKSSFPKRKRASKIN